MRVSLGAIERARLFRFKNRSDKTLRYAKKRLILRC